MGRKIDRSEGPEPRELPDLTLLHRRHPGFTAGVCHNYAEAARVCFDRYHRPPEVIQIERGDVRERFRLCWSTTTQQTRNAWHNHDDTTRDGAYAVCVAAIEASEGLVAVLRAETRTGADYYLDHAPAAPDDFETSFRLEISGVAHGARPAVAQRLREKIQQAREGDSDLPAFAIVVGFKELLVMYAPVED